MNQGEMVFHQVLVTVLNGVQEFLIRHPIVGLVAITCFVLNAFTPPRRKRRRSAW